VRTGANRFLLGKERHLLGHLHVDGNIILKCIVHRMGVAWTGLAQDKHK